ncbi:MAG TPA: phosphoribosylformylglycinamidine synthase subunit PurL [Candidatus Xenobia bacterium]|nr:phosphoribosylformylglycinamidine synthase subunit PurL [Candidatus Xenobia bacterium]
MTEVAVTPDLVAQHGLTPEEYDRIQAILGREPTFTELGIFSVMWSEHCSYKSSRVHLKRLPTTGPQVLQGPGENAGVVDVGDGYAAVFKIESHNHPSFVEPFQGAATGVGGILRDIFTMGARPIAILDALRFGDLSDPKNRAIAEGVISGIGFYGNCIGVPTVGGDVYFEPDPSGYAHNPLVNALCLGVARKDKILLARASGVGNPVIYVGAKTGRDGIHGASLLASAEFDEASAQKRPNVQIGDPFLEKLLLEALLEALDTGAIVGLQDMGAAGLTCSTCEMAARGGTGIEIELDLVPTREHGMTPYEIMLSESQERMLVVVEKGREAQVLSIFHKWGLDAVVVGHVTDDALLRVRQHGEVVAEIPAGALANDCPVYERPLRAPAAQPAAERFDFVSDDVAAASLRENFLRLLASPTIASKRWVFQQYDHTVRTNTVLGPAAGDAAVLRLKGTTRGLALTVDGNGRYCYLNPRRGAQLALAEAARNLVCVGAKPWAVTNCLNFGNPEKPEVMWQFSEVIDGMAEACRAFDTPVTGGNVSFYNETRGKSIHPTPVIGMLGVLEDVGKAVPAGFRRAGNALVLLGGAETARDTLEKTFSSSEYALRIHGLAAGEPPAIDLALEKRVHDCCLELMRRGWVLAAHDVSDGGLLVTVAEGCFAAQNGLGAELTLNAPLPLEAVCFSEEPSRIVLEVDPTHLAASLQVAAQYLVPAKQLGTTTQGEFRVRFNGQVVLSEDVNILKEAWATSLARRMRSENVT